MQNFTAVFDSGIGGLTVLAELKAAAPSRNFVYFADHAFCPYGKRSPRLLKTRVVEVARFLKDLGAQGLVVACNTASVFVGDLRQQLALPIFDVIYPTCCAICEHSYKNVAVLATNLTAKSNTYQRILNHIGVRSRAFGCSELVPLAEHNAPHASRLKTIRQCLADFDKDAFDAAILACTHFPLLKNEISECIGSCPLVSCAQPVARFFARSRLKGGFGATEFLTTGDALTASAAAATVGFDATFLHADISRKK